MGGYIANKWGLGEMESWESDLVLKAPGSDLPSVLSFTDTQPVSYRFSWRGLHADVFFLVSGQMWWWSSCTDYAYLDTASSLRFESHWLKQEGGGDLRERERERVWSNYLLKGDSWPSIVTVLISTICPVTLDIDWKNNRRSVQIMWCSSYNRNILAC